MKGVGLNRGLLQLRIIFGNLRLKPPTYADAPSPRVQELVELQRYLQTCMKETVPALMKRINIATQRVLFLLDCTLLPKEDIQLNTR